MRGSNLLASRPAFVALIAVIVAFGAHAESPVLPAPEHSTKPSAAQTVLDPNVVPAGCASCGGGYGSTGGLPGCNSCMGVGCDGPRCVPGRMECCETCEADSMFGRLCCGLKGGFCCPDPCYQPCYIPAANAAFFVDSAKPVSQMTLRWDAGRTGSTADRGEYFFGKWGVKGPPLSKFQLSGIDWDELTQTFEFAVDRFSIFTNVPYRFVEDIGAGWGDMMIGTKSLFVDSEILLLATEFKTFIPISNFHKGLGNGHVSLEPSLLMTLKVMEDTYIQFQLSEWIPISGTPGFDGAMLHYHASLNHVLMKPTNDLQLIGTMEFFGYRFQDGLYTTNAAGATASAHDDSYFSLGPGVRLVFCNKLDIGFGTGFSVTNNNLARQLYRTELRWRF